MRPPDELRPPFLVFPDRAGGFFVFQNPVAVYPGEDLAAAEARARTDDAWLAGGLQYAAAEGPAPGWWGVFTAPVPATEAQLRAWAEPGPVVVGGLSSPTSSEAYRQAFGRVRQALAEGLTYQVNLTFPVEGRAVAGPEVFGWPQALRLWLDLIVHQGREASFAVLGDARSPGPMLVSASPELFFHREGPIVEARPMKGTARRHPDPAADTAARNELASSPKCRAENLMVTDLLRNDLGRLAVKGGVSVPRLFEVEAYPTVWQMTSTVRAELGGLRLTDLLAALFPCASITGAPKLSTQRVIAEAETAPRGWYTGTLGWYRPGSPAGGPERGRFSVLIRTLVFGDGTGAFTLGVGGGVVWDSTVEGEWDEAWAKTAFLGPVRRDFSLTEAILWEPEGGFFLLEEHHRRLGAACRAFGGLLDEGDLDRRLASAVHRCLEAGVGGPLKLRVLVDPAFGLTVEAEPAGSQPEVLTVALAAEPFGPESLLWRRFKTTRRAVYDAGKVAGADQTLHYNHLGELTESTSMTLVLETGGRFLTPPLASGLLGGTFRARLLAEGRLTEQRLTTADLEAADRLWLVNSVRRWKRARRSPIL